MALQIQTAQALQQYACGCSAHHSEAAATPSEQQSAHLAEGVLAPGVDEAIDALLQVVCQQLEGVDWVVNVLGRLKVPPKAHLANYVKALPLRVSASHVIFAENLMMKK